MQRLIADANEYAASIGEASDLSIDSFADIIQAIELIQQKQNIAGTTAKEAASTLQGSLTMTKTAWQNLVTGLADPNADLGKLVTNFTDSAKSALGNLLPIIRTALQGIGKMVTELLPDIFDMIPGLLEDILPDLLDTIDVTLTQTFPVLIDVLAKNMPLLLRTVAKAGKTVVQSIFTAIDKELSGNKVYDTIKSGLSKLLPVFSDVGQSLLESGKALFASFTELVGRIDFDKIFDSITNAAKAIAPVIKSAGEGLVWLFDNAISPLIEWAANDILPAAIDALTAALRILIEVGEGLGPIISAIWDNFLRPLAEWTGDAAVIALEALADALTTVADEFEGFDWEGWYADFDNFAENWETGADSIGQSLLDNSQYIDDFFNASKFGAGWNEFWQSVGGAVSDAVDWMVERFDDWRAGAEIVEAVLEEFGDKTFDVVSDFIDTWKLGRQALEDFGVKVFDFVEDWKDNWETGEQAIEDFGASVFDWFDTIVTEVENFLDNPYQWGKDFIQSFISGLKDEIWELEGALEDLGATIYDYIHFSEPDKGALSDFETYAPDMVKTFAKGIRDNSHYIEDEMQDLSAVMNSGLNTPAYTPYSGTQSAYTAAYGQSGTVTLRLTDNANRLIAEGTAGIIDIINGNTVALSERGLASV